MTRRMSVKEFTDQGYLQELNRLFLHPRGLALGVVYPTGSEPDTKDIQAFIIDARDDPAGMSFADGVLDVKKAAMASRSLRDPQALPPRISRETAATLRNAAAYAFGAVIMAFIAVFSFVIVPANEALRADRIAHHQELVEAVEHMMLICETP